MASPRRGLHALPLLLAAACVGPADSSTAVVHNQRPFLSRDARTTPEDYVELEAGAQVDPGDRVDTPVFLKYGLGEGTEAFAGLSLYSMVDHGGQLPDGSGLGDTWLGVRHRVRDPEPSYPGFGFDFMTKLPSASSSKGLGTGEIDFFGSLNASQSYLGNDLTGFYQLGFLGDPGDPGVDLQHTFAGQARAPLDPRFTGLGELAFVWSPEQDREELTLLLGASYLLDVYTLFDLGVRVGLTHDAPDFQLVFGLSRTLGILDFPSAASAGSR